MKHTTNKFILIFAVVLLFIIFFSGSSLAAIEYDTTMEITAFDRTYTIPDVITNSSYSDYLICTTTQYSSADDTNRDKQSFIVFLYNSADTDIVYKNNSNKTIRIYNKNSDEVATDFIRYTLYDVNGTLANSSATSTSAYKAIGSEDEFVILNSTANIYYCKNAIANISGADYENVFFRPTPVEQVVLAKTAEELPGMMITALRILIPVGLVLFGMVLLVSLCRKRAISKKNLTA